MTAHWAIDFYNADAKAARYVKAFICSTTAHVKYLI